MKSLKSVSREERERVMVDVWVRTPAEISAEGCELEWHFEANSALCAYGTRQNLGLGDLTGA
jgi:hypothetical protein